MKQITKNQALKLVKTHPLPFSVYYESKMKFGMWGYSQIFSSQDQNILEIWIANNHSKMIAYDLTGRY
jgi:hypothetical protein